MLKRVNNVASLHSAVLHTEKKEGRSAMRVLSTLSPVQFVGGGEKGTAPLIAQYSDRMRAAHRGEQDGLNVYECWW